MCFAAETPGDAVEVVLLVVLLLEEAGVAVDVVVVTVVVAVMMMAAVMVVLAEVALCRLWLCISYFRIRTLCDRPVFIVTMVKYSHCFA